ncbi:hypothetical protein DM82_5412 [Burkholderia oklahomensis]|uniref:Uncharacterized protein n=1 Tax=Burkholderia oklahomensis TaxID=342113 RepID=A0AAI8FS82_9BURK|nr:hypothetical protein [Burkholderia oklahomensis]AIO70722.1 hypothetical protein DM82_5412 [Burkholderia oklahomensis]AJX34241.1 hypothetical protein BG90_5196 [Burkholderia oklahomensis C6786]SUY27033.1 Uncharacterised protein [Burkholderia oklahomensis]
MRETFIEAEAALDSRDTAYRGPKQMYGRWRQMRSRRRGRRVPWAARGRPSAGTGRCAGKTPADAAS